MKFASFNELLTGLKQHSSDIVFIVGMPNYTHIHLEDTISKFGLRKLHKIHIMEFDTSAYTSLCNFFHIHPFSIEIICLLPTCINPTISTKELRLLKIANLDKWLTNIYFKVRQALPNTIRK